MMLPFSSPLSIIGSDTTLAIKAVLQTSEMSGTQNTPNYMNVQKKWVEQDFIAPNQNLALSFENMGASNGRMVVVSNGQFITNGEGQQAQQLNVDNINFAANAIDWLSDDTGLIGLRTKGITSRPLESIEDATKSLVKYGNVFSPILLILITDSSEGPRYSENVKNGLKEIIVDQIILLNYEYIEAFHFPACYKFCFYHC